MSYVIYNINSTIILTAPAQSWGCYVESYKTESAAKAALTRLDKKGKLGSETIPPAKGEYNSTHRPYTKDEFAIAESSDFHQNIEKQVTKINLMSGKEFSQPINTHACVDPSTETYWSM